MQETFNVPDVHCDHCKGTIEATLRPLEGVQRADVNVDGRSVTVDYDGTVIDRSSVLQAIESAGYPVSA